MLFCLSSISLCKLPFRLIITHIFSFISIETRGLCGDEEKIYSFFGIFCTDPTRNLFYLFPSIEISENYFTEKSHPVIDISRVQCLMISTVPEHQMEILIENCERFHSLSKIQYYFKFQIDEDDEDDEDYPIILRNLFSKKNGFPSLRDLLIEVNECSKLDIRGWKDSNVWKSMNSLFLNGCLYKTDDRKTLEFLSSCLVNLKKFSILCDEENIDGMKVINIPQVEDLRVKNPKFIEFKTGKKLRKLSIEISDEPREHQAAKMLFRNMTSIEDFRLEVNDPTGYNYYLEHESWIYRENFKNLKLFTLCMNSSREEDCPLEFGTKLESLTLESSNIRLKCPVMTATLSSLNYENHPNLKSVTIIGGDRSFSFPISRYLVSFKADFFECLPLCELIARNEWERLEYLTLVGFGRRNRKEGGWGEAKFPRLRALSITGFGTDVIFAKKDRFPVLEYILLRNGMFKGHDWDVSNTRNVVQAVFGRCTDLTDSIFHEEGSFSNLRELVLSHCGSLRFTNEWKGIVNLKALHLLPFSILKGKEYYWDLLFGTDVAKNLIEVLIYRSGHSIGKGWTYLYKLERIEIVSQFPEEEWFVGENGGRVLPFSCKMKFREF